MALNTLEFASKFSGELDKIIVQKAVTGFMTDNVFRQKFVGAKTVIMPDIDFVGLADYDRDNGFAKGGTTVAHRSFELTKDRGRQLMIDREDLDETGIANLAGQVLGEFARTKVVPEMDAYVLSKLAGVAQTQGHSTGGWSNNTVYSTFVTTANKIQSRAGYGEELVAFVNPDFYAALMNTTEIARQITVSDFKQGNIDLKVKTLNGVSIIPVASDRMYDKFVFSNNGFTKDSTANPLVLLMLPKKCASLVKKTEVMRIFTPEQNKDADAYVFNYRLHYDVFVKKSSLDFIEAVITA